MSHADEYRARARRVRELVSTVNGPARIDALKLADDYEELARSLDGPLTVVQPGYAEQIATLVDQHSRELLAIRERETDLEARLIVARSERQILEARVDGMLEVSKHLARAAFETGTPSHRA